MAYGNRSVLLDQHHGGRFSHHQRTADHNRFLAGAINTIVIQNLHTCLGRAGREAHFLAGKYAGHGSVCHTVHILGRIQSVLNHRLVQVFGKGTEQQNAVDPVVLIYLVNHSQQFFL